MKTILKAGSVLVLVAVISSSCSVEYKTRHGKKNAVDVGMNLKDYQNSQAVVETPYAGAAVSSK